MRSGERTNERTDVRTDERNYEGKFIGPTSKVGGSKNKSNVIVELGRIFEIRRLNKEAQHT